MTVSVIVSVSAGGDRFGFYIQFFFFFSFFRSLCSLFPLPPPDFLLYFYFISYLFSLLSFFLLVVLSGFSLVLSELCPPLPVPVPAQTGLMVRVKEVPTVSMQVGKETGTREDKKSGQAEHEPSAISRRKQAGGRV